jgi:2-dehydro-3-deoxyglucarate aldolase
MKKEAINKFRRNLKKGKPLIGGWMQISNPNIAEVMSSAEYSWVAFDLEHGSFSIGDLPNLIRAVEINKKLVLVRLPNKNLEIRNQVLDAGCSGIIIPNIKNEIELRTIIKSCYYPPAGTRGVGYSRANLFGKKFKIKTENPIIIAMIENINSVNRLEKILSVKGLDAILIGPYDLSASMGITGKFKNLKFKSIIKKINKLSKKFKIPCGIHVIEPNNKTLKKYLKEGYQFLPFSTDARLLNHAIESSFKNKKI